MKFKKKILKNGLRAIVAPMKDSPTVTALILVETGSKYETKKINGLSHFLEHMCFKGTTMRPMARDISTELDALGTHYNAFTSQEYTGYYVKGDAKHFKKLFDVVSDIYLNSTFPETEMEKEKGVIIEEINMYEDMPQAHVQDIFAELLYGDQPAGWNIAGPRENIRAMKRVDFMKYKNEHYVPKATTVVIAGGIKETEAMSFVKKIFGGLKNKSKAGKIKTKEVQKTAQFKQKEKKTDQTHMVLGFRSFDIWSKKNPAVGVMVSVLSGGMSSRLFQKLREDMGVCYYVRASNSPTTDVGSFEISAGVTNNRVLEVTEEILKECKRLKTELVSKQELEKVKEYIIGNSKMALEASDDIANFLGGQEILKHEIKSPEEKFKQVRAVTATDIKRVANEIFQNNKLNMAFIGPKVGPKKLKNILKI